jgi:hypothetical protein
MKGGKKMPYLIVTALCPSDKTPEVATRMQEMVAKYPPDEKLGTQLVAAVKDTLEGVQWIGVVEVKKGKLDEAYIYVAKRMAMFQSIQGVEYRIDLYANAEEASIISPPV